jgi:hypothetical protein
MEAVRIGFLVAASDGSHVALLPEACQRLRSGFAMRGVAPVLALVFAACSGTPPSSAATAEPVRCLHGHNDYLQPVPLKKALELGLGSVEADVFLDAGELRVGHERWQLRAGRTLRSLYLEPLRRHVAANGGRVHPGDGPPFVLLVDIKAEPAQVWPALQRELAEFAPMLTRWTAAGMQSGAVTVVLSGARPWREVAAASERHCALDGRLRDLDTVPPPPADLVPWISDAWPNVSDWSGSDELLPAERARIEGVAARVHAQGRELRFWGAPDRPEAWRALRELGVDRIGTDRPSAAATFLRASH